MLSCSLGHPDGLSQKDSKKYSPFSILFFVGDAKIIGNLFYDKIFSLHLQNLWETQK